MRLHRYIVRPLSPWGTPLRGDTLCGLLLWRIAEKDGDAACRETIAAFRAGTPPFILSSAMPEGQVYAPLLPSLPRARFQKLAETAAFKDAAGEKLSLIEALQTYKKFRKLPFLPLEVWTTNAAALSLKKLFCWYCALPSQKVKTTKASAEPLVSIDATSPRSRRSATLAEPHVTIDRRAGSALEGGLFFNQLTYYDRQTLFHLYARTDQPERLLKLLRLVGELGFGKDASTGKGRFAVDEDNTFDPASLEIAGTDALLLSPCAAPDMSAMDGWYRMEVKRGKAGPRMSSPFKNSVLLVQEGSVLHTVPQGPYLLEHVHPDTELVQVTHPLTLPCCVTEEE